MRAACDRFAARVPLLANMVEGGKTPVQDAGALAAVGFRIVIFPGGTARAVAHTLQGYYGSLREHGTTTRTALESVSAQRRCRFGITPSNG